MIQVVVADQFSDRLTNRNVLQGDGKFTGKDFRRKFLSILDNQNIWDNDNTPEFEFDFTGVRKIAPSFANEVFAHFRQYANKEKVLSVFHFVNIGDVHHAIIVKEINRN